METLVRDEITKHLEKYELIESRRHGFWKGKSCLTNLVEFFENVK